MKNVFWDPQPDRELGNALREIENSWNTSDSQALRQRIALDARPKLAALAVRAPQWWELLSNWSRVVVPVGLAATLAGGLLVRQSGVITVEGSYSSDLGSDSTLVLAALSEPAVGSLFTGHLIAPAGNDWLLQEAVAQ